jgi:hypothetical protein
MVIVIEDAGNVAVGVDSSSEYQEAVAARLLISTVCVPEAVPVAAVAVRSLLEDVTVRAARGPVSVFSAWRSFSTAVVAV